MIAEQPPHLTYFQEIVPGDIRKLRAVSNDAPSGGGARDLRISPLSVFDDFMQRFFAATSDPRVREARVYWRNSADDYPQSRLCTLYYATAARKTELRITKIYRIAGWHIDETQYHASREQNLRHFFLLTLNKGGRVWARTFREDILSDPDSHPIFRDAVKKRIAEVKGNRAIRGGLDFFTGELIPHER